MVSEHPIAIVPGQSDQDFADEMKKRATAILEQLYPLMRECLSRRMQIRFDGLAIDPFGRGQIVNLHLEMHF